MLEVTDKCLALAVAIGGEAPRLVDGKSGGQEERCKGGDRDFDELGSWSGEIGRGQGAFTCRLSNMLDDSGVEQEKNDREEVDDEIENYPILSDKSPFGAQGQIPPVRRDVKAKGKMTYQVMGSMTRYAARTTTGSIPFIPVMAKARKAATAPIQLTEQMI